MGSSQHKITVDLISHAQQLTMLLNAVDCWPNGGLYSGPYALEAVRRYEQVWLPLLASARVAGHMGNLVPPLDVAFVWLVHRLNPHDYAKHCLTTYGSSLDAVPRTRTHLGPRPKGTDTRRQISTPGPFGFTDGKLRGDLRAFDITTKVLWAAEVKKAWPVRPATGKGAPEPFFPPRPYSMLQAEQSAADVSGTRRSKLMQELPAAMGRQAAFLHSLLRPCYLERPFLEAALERYQMFLQLCKENPGMLLVPMMDIDLMWHTHMGISSVYTADMLSSCGRVIGHDDSIAKADLDKMFVVTKSLFEARFPEAGPYNPPPTQLIPLASRHPLEAHLGPAMLQLFEHPGHRSKLGALTAQGAAAKAAMQFDTAAAAPNKLRTSDAEVSLCKGKGAAAGPAQSLEGHAGGHAVYLAWLLADGARVHFSFCCFGPSEGANAPLSPDQRRRAIRRAFLCGLKFPGFKRLPLRMDHIFWSQFPIRQLSAWGMHCELSGGMAVGTPVVPADGWPSSTARFSYAPSDHCPGCARSAAGGGCCCMSQRYAPYDMALLPILLMTSVGCWGCYGGAYPGNAGASTDAAAAATDSAPTGSSGADLAAVTVSPEFPADVSAVAGSDPAAWSNTAECSQWDGVNGEGYDGGSGAMCGGAACGGAACGGGGGCGGGGCGGD